jgi:hypothetical protein
MVAQCLIALFLIVGRLGLITLAFAYVIKNLVLTPLSVGAALYLLNIKPGIYLSQIAPSIASGLAMAYAISSRGNRSPVSPRLPALFCWCPQAGCSIFWRYRLLEGAR